MSDFITDVEQQYEMYCKIAEEHGFIDLNAKKNGFRCTTKSNEFNAGWIGFVGAVAAVRDEQQAIIDDLRSQLNNMEACYIQVKKQVEDQQKRIDEVLQEVKGLERFTGEDCIADFDVLQGAVSHACKRLEKTLRGASDINLTR